MSRLSLFFERLWDDVPKPHAKFELTNTPNDRFRGKRVSVTPKQMLPRGAKVFAMGSCFAVEIRNALRAAGFDTYPKYKEMTFDPATQQPGRLPRRDNINHYDTFLIRQEIERATARTHWNDDSLWRLNDRSDVKLKAQDIFQDPLRLHFYATSMDAIRQMRHMTDRCIDDGLASADVIIITLGLTEVWRDKKSSLYVCLGPKNERSESFANLNFHASTLDENRDNIRAIVKSIRSVYPDKTIVFTVSPVRLQKTWTNEDIVVANTMSKSTLRAAVGDICRNDSSIVYWPSFELCTLSNVYRSDNVHVRRDVVHHIVTSFAGTAR